MWRAIVGFACTVLLTVMTTPALAAPANGQLAAVTDDRLVTVNPDGSGLRALWTAPRGEQISGLAWSPDGNRLAFAATRRIVVYDVVTGKVTAITNPPGDAVDANPGWSADGARVGFRRAAAHQFAMAVDAAGGNPAVLPFGVDDDATALAWLPDLSGATLVVGSQLVLAGLEIPSLVSGVPAWAPDGSRIAFANADGIHAVALGAPIPSRLTAPPAGSPRWSPDAGALVYPAGTELRIVAATGGASRVVLTAPTGIVSADWQPCTSGLTVRCESVTPPRCTVATVVATTQADQPVDLPAPPCSDPAGRVLSLVVVKPPDHGTLVGRRYTPAPGFTGQDVVTYRMSNGVADSEPVRVTIFVVPRPVAAAQPTIKVTTQRTPFLSAQTKPRLDGRRRALVRLSCDQDCSFAVRLTGRLGSKRTLKGPLARRTLVARRVTSLRLRLPRKPSGRLRTVWIVGSVHNAVGVRSVKLPVRLR